MEAPLAEQIHAMMETLRVAEGQAQQIKQAMRKQSLYFGLELHHFDDDITQLLNRLQYVRALAQHREASGVGRTLPTESAASAPD